MLHLPPSLKQNNSKFIIGSVGAIVTLIGAIISVDTRYAKSTEVEQMRVEFTSLVKDTTFILRKQMLEDKLFELDIKKAMNSSNQLNSVDAALYERYKRQLDEISQRSPK